MHLVAHPTTQIVIVSISKMAGVCTHHVKTSLGRNDIKQIDIGTPVADIPLGGISIIWRRRNRAGYQRLRLLLKGHAMDGAPRSHDSPQS